ncbi:penicillin-binding transpeptidase domain-containing protein [Streptomyces sp. CA-111067]|uniref:penicillin-binding transpeptidase domain-containing protein n=1 Tax=Streptomyces sp. CA-111067 TaxID=3240046 RepID=UPI003D999E3C
MPMARGVKTGIIGAVFAGMLGVAGFGAYNIYSSLNKDSGSGSGASQTVGASTDDKPLGVKDVQSAADAFLNAWTGGDLQKAADATDSPQTALAALNEFKTDARITAVRAVTNAASAADTGTDPSTPAAGDSAGKVTFSVEATINYQGSVYPWSYSSGLTVARNAAGKPAVTWASSVVNPHLDTGDSVVTGPASTPDVQIVDRKGKVMDPATFPSLARIIPDLRTRYADKLGGGVPGVETYVKKSDGSTGLTLHKLKKGRPAKLDTTLDSTIQAAAEKAVAAHPSSGVTALDTGTGGILAVANNPADGTDYALGDTSAPGSTFKVVTAAALIERGHLTPSSPAPCRNGANYGYGKAYKNDGDMNVPGADLSYDFTRSCNTGFILQAGSLGATGLVDTAKQFGITQPWNIGTTCTDPNVPGGTGDELTSEMIGQGTLQLSPLVMASVAATAATSDFHQPVIVDKKLIGKPIAKADGIKQQTSLYLRQMMRATITDGTATGVMNGFGPDSGAKTGSAETDTSAMPNGWFVGFSGGVAASAVVHSGGHGNASAGPMVAAVLRAS